MQHHRTLDREGVGAIDYGEHSDIIAVRYNDEDLSAWVRSAGFVVSHCMVESVDGMDMDAVYLYATRQ